MKKVVLLILLVVILTGCSRKEIKEEKKSDKMLYTCDYQNQTYYYYFNNDKDPYYKAVYLKIYEFKTNKEAKTLYENTNNEWENKYADSKMYLNIDLNDNIVKINITAYPDSNLEQFIEFFGEDRYLKTADEINKTFSNKCLIKSI